MFFVGIRIFFQKPEKIGLFYHYQITKLKYQWLSNPPRTPLNSDVFSRNYISFCTKSKKNTISNEPFKAIF